MQGYHKASNLGELRNNHDPCCTYEGDNNVLGQQASNWLLRQWENGVENPSGTAEFIGRRDNILLYTFESVEQNHSLNSIECKYPSIVSQNQSILMNYCFQFTSTAMNG